MFIGFYHINKKIDKQNEKYDKIFEMFQNFKNKGKY